MRNMHLDFELIQIPQPFYEPTNVIRIGDSILDSGHMSDKSTDALREKLRMQEIKEVIVTHPHVDHVGGSEAVAEVAEKPHTVLEGGERIIRNFTEYILKVQDEQVKLFPLGDEEMMSEYFNSYFSADRKYREVNISRTVEEGDEIQIGKATATVIHTPGHEANHMSLYHEPSGTLFTGDLIAGNAQFMYAPLTSSVEDYRGSIKKLFKLEPRLIVPSHGRPIENPIDHMNKCLENVERTKSKILSILEEREKITHLQLAKKVFDVTDPMRLAFLAMVVFAYLKNLEEEGEAIVRVNEGVTAFK